jgi:DNA-binding beta-propeller fold protein YncE
VSEAEASIKASFRALIERLEAQRDELLQRLRSSQSVLRCQTESALALLARGRALVSSAERAASNQQPASSAAPTSSVVESVANKLRLEASLREVASVLEHVSVSGADRTTASFRLDVKDVAEQVASRTRLAVPEPRGECSAELSECGHDLMNVAVGAMSAAAQCEAAGPGLERVVAGTESSFTIVARDRSGAARGEGGEPFVVSVRLEGGGEVKSSVTYRGDGRYATSFVLSREQLAASGSPAAGSARVIVSVQLRGAHVARSPFSVPVSLRQAPFRGILTRKIGSEGADPGQFKHPRGVCYAPDGRMFVCDNQHTIHVFRGDGSLERKFGSQGSGNGQFRLPTGMCISPERELFVTDLANHRVQVFSLDGVFKRKFGMQDEVTRQGTGQLPLYLAMSQGIGAGQFHPYGVAISPTGKVFVSQHEDSCISVFSKEGRFLGGFGSPGRLDGRLRRPSGIAFSESGELFVADHGNGRVQVFSADGTFQRKFGTLGNGDGHFNGPIGVAVSVAGDVFVVDHDGHRLQQFGLDGSFKRVVSSGQRGAGDTDFFNPSGVTVGSAGEVAVADTNNHRVVVFK